MARVPMTRISTFFKFGLFIAMGIHIVNSVEMDPGHYTQLRDRLKQLAVIDFKTMARLRSLKIQLKPSSPLMKTINEYLEDFASCTKTGTRVTEHAEKVVGNPLSRFKLVRRIVKFFRLLKNQSIDVPGLAVSGLKDEFSKVGAPLKSELFAAADAIFRIQFTYDLNATDLAAGRINGVDTRSKLLASDCFFIGLRAKALEKYTLAFDWLREALRLAPVDRTVENSIVLSALIDLCQEHNWQWKHQELTNFNLFVKPLASVKSKEKKLKVRDVLYRQYVGKGRNCSYWPMNSWGLCSGENFHTPKASCHLFCWLEFKVNKMLTIGPLKMEFLSRNPDIVQIHQALSKYVNGIPSNEDLHDGFELHEDWLRKRVDKMVYILSGPHNTNALAKNNDDAVHYLPGDRSSKRERRENESEMECRANFVVFLNALDQGGSIVFPAALASAMPTKGSAIFWFSTLSDGTADILTEQSECPVILGEKLVAYRHIELSNGFSGQKCLLRPKERFKVLVNGKALPIPVAFKHKPADEECKKPKHLFVARGASGEHHPVGRGYGKVSKFAYTPSSSLRALVRLDWEIFQNVKGVLKALQKAGSSSGSSDDHEENEIITSYLQDFNETTYNSIVEQANVAHMEQVYKLAGNPLAAYRAVWRFENHVKKWLMEERESQFGKSQLHRRIRDYVGKVYNLSDGPGRTDLEDAMAGILNIQSVHHLKSVEVANGVVVGTHAGIILSAKQCIEIGIHAMASEFYYQAMDWLETAVNRIVSQGDRTGNLEEAQAELEIAKIAVSGTNFDDAMELNSSVDSIPPNLNLVNSEGLLDPNFIRNCRGETRQTAQEKSRLFCWKESRIHPYLRIGPIKAEILSMNPKPEVVLYHDLLGEKLQSYLRNDTDRRYNFSTSTQGGGTNSNNRLSASSFIYSTSSRESLRLFQLVNRVTGLDGMRRPIKIGSYTPGGNFLFHTDSYGVDADGDDTLIATLMFYVNQVQQGGETSFSQADVLVRPSVGSAVFWYNTLSSGARDAQTYHGSCPIIFGEKKIATHFIHYVDQHHLQCHRHSQSRIEVLINGKSKYHHSA